MKGLAIFFASFFVAFNVAAYDDLPDLGGSGYETEITESDIWDAIVDNNWTLAWNLTMEVLYQKAKQAISDEKNQARLVEALGEKLAEIINDPQKTEDEKKKAVMELMEASLTPIESPPTGDLAMAFRHSIDYGMTKVLWTPQYHTDTCTLYYAEYTCNDDWSQCWWEYYQVEKRLLQIPEYSLYRWIGTQRELVQRYAPRNITTSYTYSTENWGQMVLTWYNQSQHDWDNVITDERVFAYDPHGDMYHVGQSVAYELVVDFDYYGDSCGINKTITSFAYIDEDGDGKMDFLPEEEYLKLFGRYYGWMIPVITVM